CSAVQRHRVSFPTRRSSDLEAEAKDYLVSVRERFLNPFLKHRISDIASNHEEKKQRRFAPIIARAKELGLNLEQRRLNQALSSRSEEHTSELQSRENLVCRL